MTDKECPLNEELQALIQGKLKSPLRESISSHIESCKVCQAKVDTISIRGVTDKTQSVVAHIQSINSTAEKPEEVSGNFGRYRIEATLGKGGMGAVYLAHDPRLDRKLAIKIPFVEGLEKEAVLDRFIREARAVAQITHANICPVYDASEVEGKPYIAMAFIEGKPLSDFVHSGNPVAREKTVKLIRVLALALHYAHEKGVIHRDLKPDNIMINDQEQPVIMDFGLARRQGANETQLTQAGQLMGTPTYMSPEQVAGNVDAMGPCCDIYSLGVIMYEMLTGQRPFRGDLLSVLSQIASNNPQTPTSLNENIDEELSSICLKAMEKKPENRYASMGDFADALDDYYQRRGWPTKKFTNDSSAAKVQHSDVNESATKSTDDSLKKTIDLSNVPRPDRTARTRQTSRKPLAQPRSSFGAGWKKWVIAGGIGGAALLLLGVILLIQTKDGFIRVEVLDDQTDVVVTSIGATINSKESKPILIEDDGSGKLKISRDGFEFYTDMFEWKKGKDVAFKIDYVQGKLKVVKDGKALDLYAEQPVILSVKDGTNVIPSVAIAPFDMATAKKHQKAWADHLGVPVEMTNSIGMRFVVIPPGEYTMGERDGAVSVTLTQPFRMGVHEVTQKQWDEVMNTQPWRGRPYVKKGPDNAVSFVIWDDVSAFCRKLTDRERTAGRISLKEKYRLPTEAEWEYACRAGTTTMYSFGDDESKLGEYAWYDINAANIGESYAHPVGLKKPNAWGMYDVNGNVWEWCHDTYHEKLPGGRDPVVETESAYRVGRGGTWSYPARDCGSAHRNRNVPSGVFANLGFRVVMTFVEAQGNSR